ncbi:MAG: hypothetical protein WC736_13570 [Gallionella sp.]|jgi:hypothetical protein
MENFILKYLDIFDATTEGGQFMATSLPARTCPNISIEFPTDGLRARKVISRSNAKATGKHPSWKMGRMMHYESVHERNVFRLLDACIDVSSYHEQPCRISYVMDGVKRTHYPDVMIVPKGQKELWEIKPNSDEIDPEVAQRTAFMEQNLPHLGYGYRLITGEKLSKSHRLQNASLLLRNGYLPVPAIEREKIRQIFKMDNNIHWEFFKQDTADRKALGHVCRLILEGKLHIDLENKISNETKIYSDANFTGGCAL